MVLVLLQVQLSAEMHSLITLERQDGRGNEAEKYRCSELTGQSWQGGWGGAAIKEN